MNLFVAGWRVPDSLRQHAERAFTHVLAAHAHLDPATRRSTFHGGLLGLYAHTAPGDAHPRVYAAERQADLVFYDGCAVDPSGQIRAHDAAQLAANWERLAETLEGQYAALRLDARRGTLELLTDALGVYEVFVRRIGDAWLISNSALLLGSLPPRSGIDLVGASLFLGTGAAGGDRTVTDGVHAVPGGQSWRWDHDVGSPHRTTYFSAAETATPTRRQLPPDAIAELADSLSDLVARLGDRVETIRCPITAGRDSRLLVAMTLQSGIAARFYTKGAPDDIDAAIGREIAERLGLEHDRNEDVVQRVADTWPEISRRHVKLTDGTVTLAHVGNQVGHGAVTPGPLPLQLYGIGGELSRGSLTPPRRLVQSLSPEASIEHLQRARVRPSALVDRFVIDTARRHVAEVGGELLDMGFSPKALAEAYSLHEGVRRWGGAQFRQALARSDVFSPYCTRPFLRTAFSLTVGARKREHLQYRLLRHLHPELHGMRFDEPWRPQRVVPFYVRYVLGTYATKAVDRLRRSRAGPPSGRQQARLTWFESVLPEIRAACLDRSASDVWRIVDRQAFEAATSPARSATARARDFGTLINIATLSLYESELAG